MIIISIPFLRPLRIVFGSRIIPEDSWTIDHLICFAVSSLIPVAKISIKHSDWKAKRCLASISFPYICSSSELLNLLWLYILPLNEVSSSSSFLIVNSVGLIGLPERSRSFLAKFQSTAIALLILTFTP